MRSFVWFLSDLSLLRFSKEAKRILFIVSALQTSWAEFKIRKQRRLWSPEVVNITLGLLLVFYGVRTHSTTLSFDEALAKILDRSENLQSQRSQIQTSKILKKQAWMALTPTIGAEIRRGLQGENNDVQEGSLSAQLNLFKFGSDYFGIQAAEKKLASSEERLKAVELSEEDMGAQLLFKYLSLSQQVAVSKKNLASRRSFFKVAETRFDQGYLSKQELDKVFIDLSNDQARSADLETELNQVQKELESYIGSESSVELSWPWKEQIFRAKGVNFKLKSDFLLASHPDIKAQQLVASSASDITKQYRALMLPTIDLRFNQSVSQTNQDSQIRDWSAFVVLTIPIFNRFIDDSNYRLFNEAQIREDITLRRKQRELSHAFETNYKNFLKNADSALLREKTLQISMKLYDDNLKRFQVGRTTVNDLSVDQDRLNQALLIADQGWKTVHLSFLGLCHSLGHSIAACIKELSTEL